MVSKDHSGLLHPVFIVEAIISISNINIVLTKLIVI